MDEAVIASLRAAVAALPDDDALRLHLAAQLAAAGLRADAVREAAIVLQRDPSNSQALGIIAGTPPAADVPAPAPSGEPAAPSSPPTPPLSGDSARSAVPESTMESPAPLVEPMPAVLRDLEREMSGIVPPRFIDDDGTARPDVATNAFDIDRSRITLADVGGMAEVKARIEASVLAPIRNPELGRLYGKTLRGGLLLYGPPGCGKTFLARAIAGELAAGFMPISLNDVLDMYIGVSERNLHEIFETARANAPCVLFFDEVDALGQKRTQRSGASRGEINQLLSEMDGVAANNDGVFVLGATNHPWDVDTALRRPGRFDRMLLVLPPDAPAREAILRYHMRERPIAQINVASLAARTEGYSGADLAYLVDMASERAMMDSATSGQVRLIQMPDFEAALRDVKPSVGPWLEMSRNVVEFANQDGTYDELQAYLRKRR